MTSKWVRLVQSQRGYDVEWRFISLRLINADVDYEASFPPDYEAAHTCGLRLLRVAAAVRSEHSPERLGGLYQAFGEHLWERGRLAGAPGADPDEVRALLTSVGLGAGFSEALDDTSYDTVIQAETDEALTLTGKEVGTPILHFEPPDGVAFFGPVISRLPSAEEAAELWDHVIGLARFGGFSELKRSLRELPQLPAFGVRSDEIGDTGEAFTLISDALTPKS